MCRSAHFIGGAIEAVPVGLNVRDAETRISITPGDAVILAVSHRHYRDGGRPLITSQLKNGRGLVVDVRSILDRSSKPADVKLWRL